MTDATQVLRMTQLVHARHAIAGVLSEGGPLGRDAKAFLDATQCSTLDARIERGKQAVQREAAKVRRKGSDSALAAANARLAVYGVELSKFGFAVAKLDDVPPALLDVLQAHRKPQPAPSKTTADPAAWKAYPAAFGLTLKAEDGRLQLMEANGTTAAAFLDYHVENGKIRLGGYTGEDFSWKDVDLRTSLIAELLERHPDTKLIEVDFMDDTHDFEAYLARKDPMQTPLGESLAAFREVRAEVKQTGQVEPTKFVRDAPRFAVVHFHLSR